MIRIRLSRRGVRNDPFYRIVVIEKRNKSNGEALDVVGYWHKNKKNLMIDKKKIEKWLSKGAQISPAVKKLMEAKK